MADYILRIILNLKDVNNPKVAHNMGLNGRKFVLDNFKWDIITERLLEAFK